MQFHTIIFDLDGTLYDEERIYDHFAEELAMRTPPPRRDDLIRAWSAVKSGAGPPLIGLGYDEARDCLFTHAAGRVTGSFNWEGEALSTEPENVAADVARHFGFSGYINIGDWWGALAALGAHYGVPPEERQSAFLATRRHMESETGRLPASPELAETLRCLRERGPRLIAMSNSSAGSVTASFEQLGIAGCFDAVIADASKPAGLAAFLREDADPATAVSVGDNYVNDIEPALDSGARGLYIDRHRTDLGRNRRGCVLAPSPEVAWEWLLARVTP